MPPRNKKKRFATLWVNSPFAGDEGKCAEVAKLGEVDWQDLELRRYVDLEGGTCPVDLLVLTDPPSPIVDVDEHTRQMGEHVKEYATEITKGMEEALSTFTFPPKEKRFCSLKPL